MKQIPCIGCGALVPDIDGPTHPYIGASPGCWQIYGEVLSREYGEYRYPAVHRFTVDAYAVQHPGTPGRRSSQSVAVHLMALCLVLERGIPPAIARRRMGSWTHRIYSWLEPPAFLGDMTVFDVLAAGSLSEHAEQAQRWAQSAWDAWSVHADVVRRWVDSGDQA